MNSSYQLIYSEALNTWVAVAEHISARGKKSTLRLVTVAALLVGGATGCGWALAAQPLISAPLVNQLPTGGQVAAGVVVISQAQTAAAASMAVQQSSNQAIVNWQSFNVGANAKVNITQPGSSSVLLNRVLDANPSQIFGQINANGKVFLSNPNGIYFAPGSSVDVGSFTATTHGISDSDFLAGNYNFSRNGATGGVINQGSLKAGLGGYIALLAPEVVNQGVVVAQMGGTVAMAAGESFQLQFGSNNQLTNVLVTPSTLNALVENGNAVQAPGGLIILSAQAANGLLGGVVKNSGVISATGLVNDGGTIRLSASHKIELTPTSSITADAAQDSAGKGGRIEVIADLTQIISSTQVDGTLSAKGGDLGGDGGFIETSAANLKIADTARVSTLAPLGKSGQWLLDPNDFTVADAGGNLSTANLLTALNLNNVTITTTSGNASCTSVVAISCDVGTAGNGDITIANAISGWTANRLTLSAYRHVNLNASISGTGTSALNVTSGTSGTGKINIQTASITTAGAQDYVGAAVLGANTTLSTTNSGVSFSASLDGAYALTITSGSGNVSLGGAVGRTAPLASLTITGGATDTEQTTILAGDVKTNGSQTYGGNVALKSNLSLFTLQNGNVSIAGNVDTTVQSSLLFQFLGGGSYSYSSNSGATFVNYAAAGNSSYGASVIAGFGSLSYDSSGSGTYLWTPSSAMQASYLAIGGGGSGGGRTGGGGGAGGVLSGNAGFIAASPYSIVVGAGGFIPTAIAGESNGINGVSSSLSGSGISITALGGGGGGVNTNGTGYSHHGASGGSGGGGSDRDPGLGGAGTVNQGNRGGNADFWDGQYATGGGGGAGGVGQNGNSFVGGGAGGIGTLNPITGSTVGQNSAGTYYIAGGGGGGSYGANALGGLGGGGSSTGSSGTALALANSGGGGGGSKFNGSSSGAGGSGAVVINGSVKNNFSLSISSGSGKATVSGAVSNLSNLAIDSTHSDNQVAGVISGNAAVSKSGAGVLTLSGSNTYTGGTNLNAGALNLGSAGAIGSSGTISFGGGSLQFSASNTADYSARFSTAANQKYSIDTNSQNVTLATALTSSGGTLTKLGNGVLRLTAGNTYGGGSTVSAGTLQAGNNSALGTGTVTVSTGGAIDLNGQSVANAMALGAGASTGALINSSGTAATASGSINLTAHSSVGGSGAITLSGAIASAGYGLALLGSGAKTINNINNSLTTIATGLSVGDLSVINNAALSIGQVTTGGSTYSGINSTGTVVIRTRTGDLTVSQNVSTTSASDNTSSPALKLSAGDGNAAGDVSGGDVVLSGSPDFSVSSNGIAAIYTGSVTGSNGVASNFGAKTTHYSRYNKSNASLPASGGGYYVMYRESPIIYLLADSGQHNTYGDAPALSYWYSSSASSVVSVTYAGIPASAQIYSLSGGVVLNAINIPGGVSGSLALTGSPSVSAGGLVATTSAGSYAFTLTPNFSLTDFQFVAGNAVSYTIIRRPISITATAGQSKVYGDTDPVLTYTAELQSASRGLVSGDAFVGALMRAAGEPVATNYAVGQGALDNVNYLINFTPANFAINPKPVTLTNLARTTTYDGVSTYATLASGTAFTKTAMVGTDNVASVTQTASLSGLSQAGSFTATPSAILLGTGNAANYDFSYVSSTHAVDKASLLISAVTNTKSFDGSTSAAALPAVTGLKGADSVVGLKQVYADANPGNGKTLSVQTGFQILDGNDGNNYALTLALDQTGVVQAVPIVVLPPATQPSAAPTNSAPTLTLTASAAASKSTITGSAAAGSSSGVSISTVNVPSQQVTGLVTVLVPMGTASAGTGLVIALPEQVVAPNLLGASVQVTLPNNQPLPGWIRYDTATQSLVTGAVPQGAFPLTVMVTVGGQSTVIQISESQTNL